MMNKKVFTIIFLVFSILLTSCSFGLKDSGKISISLPYGNNKSGGNSRAVTEGEEYSFYLNIKDSKNEETFISAKSGDTLTLELSTGLCSIKGVGFSAEYSEELPDTSSINTIIESFIAAENLDFYYGTSELKVLPGKTVETVLTLKYQKGEGSISLGLAIPAFSINTRSSLFQSGEKLSFSVTPDSTDFLPGTTFKWYIDNKLIPNETKQTLSLSSSNFSTDFITHNISVIANYNDSFASKTTVLTEYEPQLIYYQYVWISDYYKDNGDILDSSSDTYSCYCYDSERNLYVTTYDSDNYLINKYTYNKLTQTYSTSPTLITEQTLTLDAKPARMTVSGNTFFYITCTDPLRCNYTDNKIYSFTYGSEGSLSTTALDDFDIITAITSSENKLYVAGLKKGEIERESYYSTTDIYDCYSCTYKVIAYSLNTDNTIDSNSKTEYYSYTDNEILNYLKEYYDVDFDAEYSGSAKEIKILTSNSITDMDVFENTVYMLRPSRYTVFKCTTNGGSTYSGRDKDLYMGALIYKENNSFKTIDFDLYDSKDAYSTKGALPIKILAIKPKKLILSDGINDNPVSCNLSNGLLNEEEGKDGYRFEQLLDGSGNLNAEDSGNNAIGDFHHSIMKFSE